MAKRSMMDQFHELKEANPGTILFFRMGDFYELFHDDAEVGSNVLGLALTSRDKNAENPIPMAGFPWHQLEENLRLMLRAGYKVTVAEQEEELREGAKLLERIVTRIYTPGSLYEESLIGSDASALLCSLMVENEAVAISMIDASTGQAWAVAFEGEGKWASIYDEIMRWNPSELVLTPSDAERSEVLHLLGMLDSIVVSQHSHQPKRASQRLKTMLEVNDLGHLDLGQSPSALQATALAADYLASVHRHDDIAIRDVEIQETSEGMVLDQTTLRNLEITQTLAGEYEGSLLWAMNKCRTAMGRRCLKSWLLRPLSNVDAMQARHASVGALMRSSKRLDLLRESLKGMLDLERLATQLKYNRSNARDLLATANAIERLPAIQRLCNETEDGLLTHLVEQLHLRGEKFHRSQFLIRYGLCKQEIGLLSTHFNGKKKERQYNGMKLGRLLDLGSRILVFINLNVCFTQRDGLLVNLIWFCGGMVGSASLISNLDIQVVHSQKVSNINCDFMLGFGQEQRKKEWLQTWRVGISQARSESFTGLQVKRNLHQWMVNSFRSMNR